MSDNVITHPDAGAPDRFTQEELDWLPWLEPLGVDDLTEAHWDGLVERGRANSPYFMLLARDPGILGARTRTDNDTFRNRDGGAPRALREFAAAATSRVNGCIYCASVHSRLASHFSKKPEDVQRLLDDGFAGQQSDPQWRAVVDAALALTRTPVQFGQANIVQLRDAGFDDQAILDIISSSAFFNWANRLMLSLGQPSTSREG